VRVIAAGGTFATLTVLGLIAGVLIGGRTGQQLWVIAGLFAGVVAGGLAAIAMVLSERR